MLVVDAGERSAVAACESLSRAGYRVGAASSQRPAPAGWSRYAERRFALPNPRVAAGAFASRIASIAAERRYRAVLPCSEGALWAISGNRACFEGSGVELGLPDEATVERCTDKIELTSLAKSAGFSAPETVVCANQKEVHAAVERIGLPAILKPRRTVFRDGDAVRHLASAPIDDAAGLDRRGEEAGMPCLLQRRERGRIVSIGGVFAGGRLLALACSRYLRTWPATAGPVSFSVSIDPSGRLLESVVALLGSLGWEGIFELEAMERAPGDFAVLDFNPRIYGSLALAVRAGAPLPAIWCDRLLNGRDASVRARPGVYYRWEDGDLRNAIALLRGRHPLRAAAVLRPRRGVAHAYFRWYDPVPFAVRALGPLRAVRNADVA